MTIDWEIDPPLCEVHRRGFCSCVVTAIHDRTDEITVHLHHARLVTIPLLSRPAIDHKTLPKVRVLISNNVDTNVASLTLLLRDLDTQPIGFANHVGGRTRLDVTRRDIAEYAVPHLAAWGRANPCRCEPDPYRGPRPLPWLSGEAIVAAYRIERMNSTSMPITACENCDETDLVPDIGPPPYKYTKTTTTTGGTRAKT
jgi:hypothetical protein